MNAAPSAPRARLSGYLLRITAATLLPLLVFALVAGWLLARHERATFERGAQERVRALASAIDAELRGAITTLQAMAQSNALREGDLAAFHELALRVKGENPSWLSVNLALPDTAQQVVNVLRPYGSELPAIAERASFDAVLAARRPVVGDLVYGLFTKKVDFTVRVPVLVEGQLRYVLSAVLDPALIQQLLAEQRFPADWVGVALDRQRKVVARTVAPEATVGQPASRSLRDALGREREGFFHGSTIENVDVYTPFFTSAFSGWSVAVGIPRQAVEAGGRQAAWTLLAGAVIALLAAVALAQWLGRRIAEPIAALAGRARSLAAGEGAGAGAPLRAPALEIEQLAAAFEQAAAAVHARDAIQRERAELLAREQALRAEAEAANRAKDEFLAMLGHELRNPLGAIGNAAHVARLRPGSSQAERAQQVIARQVAHLTRLVDDLLDAARVASGKIVLDRAPLDLAEVVRRSAAAFAERAAQHALDVDLEPAWVHGDETRLEQVVGNLLANALRYTPAGGRIDVRLRAEQGVAVLKVSDTGIGIAPELLPRLFDPFVQGSRSIERRQGGLGIGLTLVRRLTELHGGKVEATSAGLDRGSCFAVRLPRIDAPPEAGVRPVQAAAAPRAAQRVLVVEDNDDARESLRSALELAGHEVIERADGPRGIEAALALRPDVALVDIGLPGASGYEVAQQIRADEGTGGMLLVALTGYGQPEDRARSVAAGFDLHATKPIDLELLLRTIAHWPEQRGQPASREHGGVA